MVMTQILHHNIFTTFFENKFGKNPRKKLKIATSAEAPFMVKLDLKNKKLKVLLFYLIFTKGIKQNSMN